MLAAGQVPDTSQKFWHLLDIYWPIGVGVFVVVVGFLAFAAIRFRSDVDEFPEGRHEWPALEYSYAGVIACIMGFLLYLTFNTMWSESETAATAAGHHPNAPKGSITINVVAAQWGWRFRYPNGAIVEGDNNHYPTLTVPARRAVHFQVTSTDVIHSFWIVSRKFKVDAFPRRLTTTNLIWPKPGYWPIGGRCNQYCGLYHTTMNFNVRALPGDRFDAWLSKAASS